MACVVAGWLADVNIVRLLGGVVEGNLVAKWEVLGANDWKVIFDTITFKGKNQAAAAEGRHRRGRLTDDGCLPW